MRLDGLPGGVTKIGRGGRAYDQWDVGAFAGIAGSHGILTMLILRFRGRLFMVAAAILSDRLTQRFGKFVATVVVRHIRMFLAACASFGAGINAAVRTVIAETQMQRTTIPRKELRRHQHQNEQ